MYIKRSYGINFLCQSLRFNVSADSAYGNSLMWFIVVVSVTRTNVIAFRAE